MATSTTAGPYTLTGTSCPACGGADMRHVDAFAHDVHPQGTVRLSILQCTACQLAWQYPPSRSSQESVAFFSNSYSSGANGSYFDPQVRLAVARLQVDLLAELFDFPGRLLDIGCGAGEFVRMAGDSGWQALGIDIALSEDQSVSGSESIHGSWRLQANSVEGISETDFDLVTLWDVIEHLDAPIPVLGAAIERLREGGALVVETGNYESKARIEGGASWWNYQADHRWYFSPKSLMRLLRQVGFQHLSIYPRVLRPSWHGVPHIRIPSTVGLINKVLRRPLDVVSITTSYNTLRNIARIERNWAGLDIITIIARKP